MVSSTWQEIQFNPNAEVNLDVVRKQIWVQATQFGVESLDGKYGIKIIRSAKHMGEHVECLSWIFGEGSSMMTVDQIRRKGNPISSSDAREGDIAIYLDEEEDFARHIGLVTDHDTIIGKWTRGPLIDAPPEIVPSVLYGEGPKYIHINNDDLRKSLIRKIHDAIELGNEPIMHE